MTVPLRRDARASNTISTIQLKGLIGFDVEPGSHIVRPELLRLFKQGTNRTADGEFALAA